MPSDYARRGRPRGSGLDDRVHLRRIVELLEADPNLKPTTAIKAIGVSDPSTIRRLRDKLKAEPNAGVTGFAASGGGLSAGDHQHAAELMEARRSLKPAQPDRPMGSSAGAALSPGLAEAHQPSAADVQLAWFTQWCALGLSAVSSTVEAQMAVMEDLFRAPQVECALRQQLLFNEVAQALCPKRSDIRPLLH